MKILFHRYTPWQQHIKCSTNIFAEQFIKHGHKVSYMYALMNSARIKDKSKMGVWLKGLVLEKGAYLFTPFSLVPFAKGGIFSKPWAADAMYQYCVPSIPQILKKDFGEPDVIWTVPPGSSYLGKLFPEAKLIMQVVDYYPAFLGDRIKEIEKRDYERAHHIFVIGHTIYNYLVDDLKVDKSKITVLGQGVYPELYDREYEEPEDIKNLPHPRATWVGVLSKGDSGLFEKTAQTMDKLGGSLVLVGPGSTWATNLAAKYSCVKLTGARMPEEVPAYLKHSDLGVMLYDRTKQDIYKGQNPLKLYEYTAAGLPVISTAHNEYDYVKPPVQIIATESDVEPAINKIVRNLTSMRAESAAFGREYSWQKVYETAYNKINEVEI